MKQSGQVLLLVVLITVVSLTVGLSLAAKSITSVRTATEEENSQQAFSAAEAGVEQVLQQNASLQGTTQFSNNAKIQQAKLTCLGSCSGSNVTQLLVNNGNTALADQGSDVWLISHNASDNTLIYTTRYNGTLTIYWGQGSTNCSTSSSQIPALEAVLLTGTNASTAVSTHYVADPCSTAGGGPGPRTNNLPSVTASTTTINGQSFNYKLTLPPITDGLLLRVIPLYEDSVLAVSGTVNLPQQGTVVTSLGVAGDAQRQLSYYRSYPSVPVELFPNILFSN